MMGYPAVTLKDFIKQRKKVIKKIMNRRKARKEPSIKFGKLKKVVIKCLEDGIFNKFPNSIYDTIQFHIKVNDPKYIIYSISGVIYFNNNNLFWNPQTGQKQQRRYTFFSNNNFKICI